MRYEKLLNSRLKDPAGPYPLIYHSFFEGNLFFEDPQAKFPLEKPGTKNKEYTPSQREVYRNKLLEEIDRQNIRGAEHFKEYILEKFRKHCSKNTIRNAYTSIFQFLDFVQSDDKASFDTLSRTDLESFIEYEQDRGLKPCTIRTRLACLYAFIRFLVNNKVVGPELLERKIHIKQPATLPRSIDPDDVERILAVLDDVRDRAMILLLLRTGMRIGELLKTRMVDISLEDQMIMIYESEKTGAGRVVYFGNDAAEALYNWLMARDVWKERLFYSPGRNTLSYTTAWMMFKRYLEKAGLSHKNYSLHCLRHTFATGLLNARISIEVLRDLLGHTTLEQTRRYANLSDKMREEEYFRAMNIIEGGGTNE